MSFITKRERVFNEYDLYDLPARNEGKLKAYASCTDARAWSHFCSDKSDHLVEVIKRNNDTCRPKYVPTEAIVNTIMSGKNAEIARLNRKIEEFEQMLAAYDDLELTCDQKCEIAKAHAAIKEANKELNELWFDLDLSGFTGGDSDGFETGKSRGDEPSKFREDDPDETPRSKGDEWSFEREAPLKESKANQAGVNDMSCACDASTNAVDPRIDEMQDTIISKDAKLNAMRNTIAVMENDVCEPYCIYAHIYTALEKIFGILCQNDKYKLFLDLMTSGKDTNCIDIKGKILFKLKVLEKFSLALIAPCSQDFSSSQQDCSCYRTEIVARVETALALTSAETQQPCLDNKRAQLVADIMENDEMKEILSKENTSIVTVPSNDDINKYNIDEVNLKRLKALQENYDDLMTCYESLKLEKECLQMRCKKYEALEKEIENLQSQLREYNALWNEKEHYRKRSVDLDDLKAQYMVLCDETSSLETQLKAELEINAGKNKTIKELRCDIVELEQKLNEASINFKKERSSMECKIKEYECTIMCQKQQINSLSERVDKFLEQEPEELLSRQVDTPTIVLIDEIKSLKDQIKNLKGALCCNKEENLELQEEYNKMLNIINELKSEEWNSGYKTTLQRNEFNNSYEDSLREEINRLILENQEKANAIDDLRDIVNNKSQEVNKLMNDIDLKNREIENLHKDYTKNIATLESDRVQKNESLQLVRQESQELYEKVKSYEDLIHKNNNSSQLYSLLLKEYEKLQLDQANNESINSLLQRENQRLKQINNVAVSSIDALEDENNHLNMSLELTKKDSENRFHTFKEQSVSQLEQLKVSNEELCKQKLRLENELSYKNVELQNAIELTKKDSKQIEETVQTNDKLRTDLKIIDHKYKKLIQEHQHILDELEKEKTAFNVLQKSYHNLQAESGEKTDNVDLLSKELAFLQQNFNNLTLTNKELSSKIRVLQSDFDKKNEELNILNSILENKTGENKELLKRIQSLKHSIEMEEYNKTKTKLNALRKESDELTNRATFYETLQKQYNELKKENERIKIENDNFQKQLHKQMRDLTRIESDSNVKSTHQMMLAQNEGFEKCTISPEFIGKPLSNDPYKDIKDEIEQMKIEKIHNQNKIRDYLDQIDKLENDICNLKEDILKRDDTISILENHINDLHVEIETLHSKMAEIVVTGEEIKDNGYKKLNESLNSMEARHSRATHNMKIEIANLKSNNIQLEERLSINKIKSEDSARDINKYISQISNLENEKEIVVTVIKQIELKSIGDSALSPMNCNVEAIIVSLDRIRKYLDTRSTKNTSLEQALLKVQSSYQLVQNKADEAKKIVEKEKQKILIEKEDAIKDRFNMERQLIDLKTQLEEQKNLDKNIIKDLEAEVLNQQLLMEKLNQSTASYISTLKEKLESINELYQGSLETVSELQNQLQTTAEEKSRLLGTVNEQLVKKCNEIDLLRKELDNLTNKTAIDCSTQISSEYFTTISTETQTDKEEYESFNENDIKKNIGENKDINENRKNSNNIGMTEYLNRNTEVQVLSANVEPTFDTIRNNYLNHKLKSLSLCQLESYSISCDNVYMDNEGTLKQNTIDTMKNPALASVDRTNLIDIYKKRSMHTDSSKIIDSNYLENESPFKNSSLTDLEANNTQQTAYSEMNNINVSTSKQKNSDALESESENSTDKDLFVIYKDSDNKNSYDKPWPANDQSDILVESVNIHSDDTKHGNDNQMKKKEKIYDKSKVFDVEEGEDLEDDSVKNKILINMPRVESDTPTLATNSEFDNKSLHFYTMANYSPKEMITEEQQEKTIIHNNNPIEPLMLSITNNNTHHFDSFSEELNLQPQSHDTIENSDFAIKKDHLSTHTTRPNSALNKNRNDLESHHSLTRIGADERLLKPNINENTDTDSATLKVKNSDYGLDFILETIHFDPDSIKMYNAAKSLRKTRSDEQCSVKNMPERRNTSPSRLYDLTKSSTDNKTASISNYSKSTDKSQSKTFTEQSIMVKSDTIEEYENKIKYLTKNLENIQRDYKIKIESIKMQYDSNIKSILNNHNQGVRSIQSLHEETLQGIMKHHENEVENLRSMSIEAMRKAEKLEKENQLLKGKIQGYSSSGLDEEPIKMTPEMRKRKKSRGDTKTLTRTYVEEFNLPRSQSSGPCTCSLEVSDTIRNIFQQVDAEQRKKAEHTYLKYIANKILNSSVEALDCQELSFLHLKVCRIWKVKLSKEEALQKRIDSLEAELIHKQHHTQQNIAELDRKVTEERRRLQEVREAVFRSTPQTGMYDSLDVTGHLPPQEKDFLCNCSIGSRKLEGGEKDSAGDIPQVSTAGLRVKRGKTESNRAVLAKLDADERREKKLYHDEAPTRLRRPQDRFVKHNKR